MARCRISDSALLEAAQLKYEHPKWPDKKVAAEAGMARSTLCRKIREGEWMLLPYQPPLTFEEENALWDELLNNPEVRAELASGRRSPEEDFSPLNVTIH